jgi:medium-chain acyl-[acyl-carrier-protein] hydrolase
MGALIAFELARSLRSQYGREPEFLFVSGRRPPHLPDSEPPTYNLPDSEFVAHLQRIDGTPKEVLEHAELMELMIPLLRQDFEVSQTYEYIPDAPLGCPIIAYGGLSDEVTRELLLHWKEQTTSTFGLHMLPGGHFFPRSSQTTLLQSIRQELNRLILYASSRA